MRFLFLGLNGLSIILLAGCCCTEYLYGGKTSSTGSTSCPYGTFGETCTKVCDSARPGESGCFSECTSAVRDAGQGDATTCCTQTMQNWCQQVCSSSPALTAEMSECLDECTGTYAIAGLGPDDCYIEGL